MVRFLFFSFLILSNTGAAKIASFDLCADQWIMTFFSPDAVAFLTPLSRDPNVSFEHKKAHTYRIDTPSIEKFLSNDIDVVLATDYIDPSIKNLLEKNGINVLIIPTIKTVPELIYWARHLEKLSGKNLEIIHKLQSIKKKEWE